MSWGDFCPGGAKFHHCPFRYISLVLYLKSTNVIENVNYESNSNGHVGNMLVYAHKKLYPEKSDLVKSCQIVRHIVIRVTTVKSTKILCISELLM